METKTEIGDWIRVLTDPKLRRSSTKAHRVGEFGMTSCGILIGDRQVKAPVPPGYSRCVMCSIIEAG